MNQQEILATAMDKAIDVWDLGILLPSGKQATKLSAANHDFSGFVVARA
jgi:hypothetical protein